MLSWYFASTSETISSLFLHGIVKKILWLTFVVFLYAQNFSCRLCHSQRESRWCLCNCAYMALRTYFILSGKTAQKKAKELDLFDFLNSASSATFNEYSRVHSESNEYQTFSSRLYFNYRLTKRENIHVLRTTKFLGKYAQCVLRTEPLPCSCWPPAVVCDNADWPVLLKRRLTPLYEFSGKYTPQTGRRNHIQVCLVEPVIHIRESLQVPSFERHEHKA